MTRATVPWFPRLASMEHPEMPGSAVRLLLLVHAVACELGPVDSEVLAGGIMVVAVIDRNQAYKTMALACLLGIIGAQPVTSTRVIDA